MTVNDSIADLIAGDSQGPSPSYREILASGLPHRGGLAQLAAAEALGGLWNAERPTNDDSTQVPPTGR